jgi:hypothetical protein
MQNMRKIAIPPVAVALVIASLALPGAAGAAAPWSVPGTVPDTQRTNPFTTAISLGDDGRGVLGFTSTAPPSSGCTQIASVAGVGRGAPGRPRALSPYDLAAPPASYANIHSILVQRRTLNRACTSSRLAVSIASVPGSLGTRRILDDSVRLRHAAVAVNAGGQAAIAWTEDKGYKGRRANPDRLYLSLRPKGGRFGAPSVLVGSGKLSGVSVAYGSDGDLLVAFERQSIDSAGQPGPRRVQARFRRTGHGFGAIADLGPEQGVTDIATAVTPNGRGYVAWGTQDGGIEANDPFNVYAATKPAGPHSFRSANRLFTGRGRSVDRPGGRLGLGTSGESALLAFNGVGDGGPAVGTIRPVLASSTDASATFTAPAPVAGGNGIVGGVAVQPDGGATIVWTGQTPGGEEATAVFAATRPPGGAFPPGAELVAALPPLPAPVPTVAAPRQGGTVQAAWHELGVGIRVSRRGP